MDATKPGEKVAVLFVESEDNLCRMIGRLLSGSRPDVEVIFASNGNQAVEKISNFRAEEKSIDLLVTDYAHPPGPHGVELIQWVRELPDDFTMGDGRRISRLPIIMQSGNHRAHTAQDFDPDVVMLPKPYKFDSLLAAMDVALQKARD